MQPVVLRLREDKNVDTSGSVGHHTLNGGQSLAKLEVREGWGVGLSAWYQDFWKSQKAETQALERGSQERFEEEESRKEHNSSAGPLETSGLQFRGGWSGDR